MQGHFSGGKYAQISVKRKDPLIRLHGQCGTNGNRFLTNTAEPFTDLTLPQEDQHFFFNHPRQQNGLIYCKQAIVGVLFSVELHSMNQECASFFSFFMNL